MGKKRRTNWKVSISLSELERLAPRLLSAFGLDVPSDRMTMTPSSGVWQKADGTMTARLVYRSIDKDGEFSKIYTLRNIIIHRGKLPEGAHG